MVTEFQRRTLARAFELTGKGLHSGTPVSVRVEPGDDGFWFHCGSEKTKAIPENVTDTSRCTKLGEVSTVEHVLSALAGMGVTDAVIVLDAKELPASGGNSRTYADLIAESETVVIGTATFQLFERVFFAEGHVHINMAKGSGHWQFEFESGDRWPCKQSFECVLDPETYRLEVSSARTFAFEEEVAPLRAAGLGQGLDESSALILGRDGYLNKPLFDNEPARHKLLDLVGDLSLSGVPPQLLSVSALRSGHKTNVEAARRLAAHARIERV